MLLVMCAICTCIISKLYELSLKKNISNLKYFKMKLKPTDSNLLRIEHLGEIFFSSGKVFMEILKRKISNF